MSGLTADFDDRQAALYLAQGQAALQAGDAPAATAGAQPAMMALEWNSGMDR